MDEEQVVPAPEEPRKGPGFNKLLFPLVAMLILGVGAGAFLLGSQRAQAPSSSSPSPTALSTQTQGPSPSESPTASPTVTESASPAAPATGTPTSTPTTTPTPTAGTFFHIEPSFTLAIFQITDVNLTVDSTTKHGGLFCLANRTFYFTGKIISNRAGTASFKWERSDGIVSSSANVSFASAETKTVNTSWTVPGTGTRWMKLHVTSPNDKSAQVSFTFSCP